MALINYSKGDGGAFKPLPAGSYDVEIKSAEQGASSKGNPQLTIKGEVVDGEYAGKKVTMWYSLLPQSTWRLDALFSALAIDPVPTGELDENGKEIMSGDTDLLIGRVVRFACTQRTYEGKVNNNWADETCSPHDPYYAQVQAKLAAQNGETAAGASSNAAAPASSAAPAQGGAQAAPAQPTTSEPGRPLARRPRPA